MLRIPGASDNPPPLVLALRSVSAEMETSTKDAESGRREQRKRLSRKSVKADWEEKAEVSPGLERNEKSLKFRWLLAGAAMLSVIVLVVILVMAGGKRVEPTVTVPPSSPVVMPGQDSPVPSQRSETAFLAEAEPMAKKLTEATCIEELLPLVRNPELAEVRMRRFYPDGKITPLGMTGFNTMADASYDGSIWTVMVGTRDFVERPLFFVESPEGIKIDWESWVGWSEISWAEFLASRQSAAKLFRVKLGPVAYYNYAFSDDKKWQSYWVESPDGECSAYAYVERASRLNSQLLFPPEMKMVSLTLMLKFPENATSSNQVIIDKVVSEGWVLENETIP